MNRVKLFPFRCPPLALLLVVVVDQQHGLRRASIDATRQDFFCDDTSSRSAVHGNTHPPQHHFDAQPIARHRPQHAIGVPKLLDFVDRDFSELGVVRRIEPCDRFVDFFLERGRFETIFPVEVEERAREPNEAAVLPAAEQIHRACSLVQASDLSSNRLKDGEDRDAPAVSRSIRRSRSVVPFAVRAALVQPPRKIVELNFKDLRDFFDVTHTAILSSSSSCDDGGGDGGEATGISRCFRF